VSPRAFMMSRGSVVIVKPRIEGCGSTIYDKIDNDCVGRRIAGRIETGAEQAWSLTPGDALQLGQKVIDPPKSSFSEATLNGSRIWFTL
jgi:hypothetical protein